MFSPGGDAAWGNRAVSRSNKVGDSVFHSRPVAQALKEPIGRILCLCSLIWLAPVQAEDVEDLLKETRQQLDQVRGYASALIEQLQGLKADLETAESRNQSQNRRIAELEQRLAEIQLTQPLEQSALETSFYTQLAGLYGPSPLIQIDPSGVRISSDPIFVFGTGELGAEGRRRLAPFTAALLESLALLPQQRGWRLRIEGHTDSRPLKNSARFPTNWELSTARAVAVLRYLKDRGVPEDRLLAAGYAASRRLDEGDNKAAHRRNRRVEIRLEFDAAGAGSPG